MADYTKNYNLKKPLSKEPYDVEDQNGNMDILDAVLAEHQKNTAIHLPENGIMPLERGGTGGTTAADARANLGAAEADVHNMKTYTALSQIGCTLDNDIVAIVKALPPGANIMYHVGNKLNTNYVNYYPESYMLITIKKSWNGYFEAWASSPAGSSLISYRDVYFGTGDINQDFWSGWFQISIDGFEKKGSYVGNSDSTSRTIDTGNFWGKALVIVGGDYAVIVTSKGAIYWNAADETGVKKFKKTEVMYNDGILIIATDNIAVNKSGLSYQYHSL